MRQSRRTTSSVIRHGHDRFITVSFQSRRSHGTQGDKTAGSDRLSFRHKAEPAFMSRSEKNSAVALSAEEVAVVKQLEGKLKNPIFADAVTAQLSAGTRRTLAISAINHDTHYYAPGQRAAAAAAADLNNDGYIHRRELNKWLATYGASVSSKIDIKIAPTRLQLALVAFNASIPFIGFGFLDNFIMITAGDMIDAKLGTTLALSSLGAAALGNTVSDVTGMGVGGIIEEGAKRLGLPQAKLSPHQMDLAVTKFAGTLGGTFGIAMGCVLGMCPLLFIDVKAKERRARLRAAFDKTDADGNGYIDRTELKSALEHIGLELTAEHVQKMMEKHDLDGQRDEQLSFDEFVKMVENTGLVN